MTYCDAIQWFKSIGARVEPGPRPGDVTLFWDRFSAAGALEATQTQAIDDPAIFVGMAEISRRAHLRNRLNGNGRGLTC